MAAATLVLLAAACVNEGIGCPQGMDDFVEFNVYFGQEKGDGTSVTEDEWAAFLADTVTPRFPGGLTVLDARGQWLDAGEGRLYRESTKLLNVLTPAGDEENSAAKIRDISDAYKARFQQQAVFLTALPACARVY